MERFGKERLPNSLSHMRPLRSKHFAQDVQVSIEYKNTSVVKRFLYPHATTAVDARDRILGWSKLSRISSSIPNLELHKLDLSASGLEVVISQAKCQRLKHRRDLQAIGYLEGLKESLEEAWKSGLVHGDLNRKNILLTCEGFKVVDIEPLICVPTRSCGTLMRTTAPYIAHSDLMHSTITAASDRLGLKCFAAWISGHVDHPWKALYI